ncbi:hypothetical protein HALA3H3_p20064 [Halomonas sp. A3H3]|nr:hypothetical protein HALA3H3_p20064 [Halomonas sp. A3H3]
MSVSVMPSARQRLGGIDAQCRTHAEQARQQADQHDDPEQHGQVLGEHGDVLGKKAVERVDQQGAHHESHAAHQQGLLQDEADDGAIGRTDQLQHRDRPDLVHGQGIDDEGNDHGGHRREHPHEKPELATRTLDDRAGQKLRLLRVRQGREMLPAADRISHLGGGEVGLKPDDHGIDQIAGRALRPARRFPPHCRRRLLELQLLGVPQRCIDNRIPREVDNARGQADDGVVMASSSQLQHLAHGKASLAVGDQLIMASCHVAARDDTRGSTRPARLIADDLKAQLATGMFHLHVLKGDGPSLGNAIDPRHNLPRVTGDARRFRERPVRPCLDHPDVGVNGLGERKGIGGLAPIDTRHGDHHGKQQAQAEARQQEASQVVADIAPGEVHSASLPSTIVTLRPAWSSWVGPSTSLAPSGTPLTISTRPSSVRWPSLTWR